MADPIPDNPIPGLPEPTRIPAPPLVPEPKKLNPLPGTPEYRQSLRDEYYTSLYTQLIIYGKSPNLASELAKEAADHIMRAGFPFPQIKVG